MSKKYIFFKFLQPVPLDFISDKTAFPWSAASQTITNILQLNENQELRFVISKELSLQAALTSSLPQAGVHGLLWSGADWPTSVLSWLFNDRIHSIFVFYKTGERPPQFLTDHQQTLVRKWEIYNWHICQFPGFQLIKNQLFLIRSSAKHEREVDENFTSLWQTFKNGDAFPWLPLDKPIRGLQKNQSAPMVFRPLVNLQLSSQEHVSSLVEFVLPKLEGTLYLSGRGSLIYFWPALFLPVKIKFWPSTQLQKDYFKTAQHIFDFQTQGLARTISLFMSDLQRLLISSEVSQRDLFYGDLEAGFVDYWQKEKRRLAEAAHHVLDFTQQKLLAAAKYLIHRQSVIGEDIHRAFLRLALAQTVAILLSGKKKPDFLQILKQTLRDFYLDFYASRQIGGLIKEPLHMAQKGRKQKSSPVLDAVIAEFYFTENNRRNEKRELLEILLYGRSTAANSFVPHNLNLPLNKAVSDRQMSARLGQYCVSLLLERLGKKEEKKAALLLRRWQELFYFLLHTAPRLVSGGKIALVLHKGNGMQENNEWRRVMESFLQNGLREMRLNLLDVTLNEAYHSQTILFLEKR